MMAAGRQLLLAFALLLPVATVAAFQTPSSASSVSKRGAAININLNKGATQELFDRWLSQAMSGLMSAMAQKEIHEAPMHEQQLHTNCSKSAKNVPEHAKCVARLLRVIDEQKTAASLRNLNDNNDIEWRGGFAVARAKRQTPLKIRQSSSYSLTHPSDESPFSRLARIMTSQVRALKGETHSKTWHQTLADIHDAAAEEKANKKKKRALMNKVKAWLGNTPKHLNEGGWQNEALQMMDDEFQRKEQMLRKANVSDDIRIPLSVMREAVKLGMQLSGQNVTGFDKKTLRIGSPRFFSVVKDQVDEDTVSLLSPSLFSLHDEGTGEERKFSLGKIFKNLGPKEQNAWLDFIVEASGVTDAVEETQKKRKAEKSKAMRTPDGTPLYFTRKNVTEMFGEEEGKKVDVFDDVAKKYTDKQKIDLDKQGFAHMSPEQIDIMYGEDSPYHDPVRIAKFKAFSLLDEASKQQIIKNDIITIAENEPTVKARNVVQVAKEHHQRRKRDIIFSPIINTPLVLIPDVISNLWIVGSPVVFSPVILSPSVWGPFILSPWLFIPVILAPRIGGPLILSPFLFSPIVLSPLVLHPQILSPGLFNPLVLSPFVLSPFILSPQVFTPIILSPFALSPLILNPMVGSPLILSPFVLSPIILSPQALFAVVLSPYALSPLVESKLIVSEVVASPSFLS